MRPGPATAAGGFSFVFLTDPHIQPELDAPAGVKAAFAAIRALPTKEKPAFALVGGDIVAKEAEDGTLRMILSRPISRLRLILIKWLAGMVFSLLLVIALGAFGILFSSFWFPWGGMFVFVPGDATAATKLSPAFRSSPVSSPPSFPSSPRTSPSP